MNVLFMGTPEFAVMPLERLIQSEKHKVVAVISQPDKPKGRGNKLQPTPVKALAMAHDIPVYQPERIKTRAAMEILDAIEADIYIVVAYGQILSKEILAMPSKGCINIHGSLLPAYRGPAPIQRAILNGDSVTGVTIMYMDAGMDTGDMLLKKELTITPEDTSGILHEKLSVLGADALLETLDAIASDGVVRTKQDDSRATYAPMLTKQDGHIDWNKSSVEIINLIRGLNPWPSAFSYLDGKLIKIWRGKAVPHNSPMPPGSILTADAKEGISVKTGDGALIIIEMQAQGSKRMGAADYVRGNKIPDGALFI